MLVFHLAMLCVISSNEYDLFTHNLTTFFMNRDDCTMMDRTNQSSRPLIPQAKRPGSSTWASRAKVSHGATRVTQHIPKRSTRVCDESLSWSPPSSRAGTAKSIPANESPSRGTRNPNAPPTIQSARILACPLPSLFLSRTRVSESTTRGATATAPILLHITHSRRRV